jgi:pimeloyl-ACP methyl ester carboxylesterase
MTVRYQTQTVGDVEVFYREAGSKGAPTLLLLHGYPTSSHMFRELIPRLEDHFHLIAPDLPGFGQTKAPPREQFDYTFDNLEALSTGSLKHWGFHDTRSTCSTTAHPQGSG